MYKGTYTLLKKDILSNYEMSFNKKRFATSAIEINEGSNMLFYNSVTSPETKMQPISNSLLTSYGYKATKTLMGYRISDVKDNTLGFIYSARKGKIFHKYNYIQFFYNNLLFDIYPIEMQNDGKVYLIYLKDSQIAQIDTGRIAHKRADTFLWYSLEKDYFDLVGYVMTYMSYMNMRGRRLNKNKPIEKELLSYYNPFFNIGD